MAMTTGHMTALIYIMICVWVTSIATSFTQKSDKKYNCYLSKEVIFLKLKYPKATIIRKTAKIIDFSGKLINSN